MQELFLAATVVCKRVSWEFLIRLYGWSYYVVMWYIRVMALLPGMVAQPSIQSMPS